MKFHNLIILLLCFLKIVNSQKVYSANWTEINSRPNPGWYDDVKFGIFIHFGVYSVPAFASSGYAEWYWSNLVTGSDGGATRRYHDEKFGVNFTYQEFAPMFNCRDFNPDEWASIIEKAGAKYVVLTSKHHEGFTLWDSPQSWSWNSVDIGPHLDIVGALTKSVKALGLHMGVYHSLYEWFNPLYLADAASGNPPKTDHYVTEILMKQLIDVVERYEPEVIWADGDWLQMSSFWRSTEFLSWLYTNSSVKDTVVVNDRWGKECRMVDGGFFTGSDMFNPLKLMTHKWENCATIGHSYGYNQYEKASDYQNSTMLIQGLVTTVACGGNYLLDIGPDSEGTIPIMMVERLMDIGYWLEINGEGIYGSTYWRVQNQTFNIWYTTNTTTSNVYAFVFELPEDGVLHLNAPIGSIKTTAILLGLLGERSIEVTVAKNSKPGISLKIPFVAPQDYPPFGVYVFKLTNVK